MQFVDFFFFFFIIGSCGEPDHKGKTYGVSSVSGEQCTQDKERGGRGKRGRERGGWTCMYNKLGFVRVRVHMCVCVCMCV